MTCGLSGKLLARRLAAGGLGRGLACRSGLLAPAVFTNDGFACRGKVSSSKPVGWLTEAACEVIFVFFAAEKAAHVAAFLAQLHRLVCAIFGVELALGLVFLAVFLAVALSLSGR